ncbi:hypothetical protein [Cyclobacterium plantarum]|uniref:hypothetical protein n=1 Tax=Cyclobacterium plantarum TaxID=2716263 RepID=UPI0037443158
MILLQLIYQRVKCSTTLGLIPACILRRQPCGNGRGRKEAPKGSPLSPLLMNILGDVLDKELDWRTLRYVLY